MNVKAPSVNGEESMPGKLRLRADLSRLDKQGRKTYNVTDASYDLRAARETAKSWVTDPSSLQRIDLDLLAALLVRVYGMDPSAVMRMRLGDLFDWVE